MQAKLGVSMTPKNIKIELEIEGEIHNSNIRKRVKSVVLDPTTTSHSITTPNLI
ncbi:MAG: hypothetical protein PG981_000589 [Wolbachia endosymbiont of Ctenocephalides orientis wCori]|nr:MAG: hypothetical protein PG981_000589 [Wolbachia endosymbiont of Ctenocephalides orientis wCori]